MGVSVRDPKRIPLVLEALRIYWEQNPDLRLGQLLNHLAPFDAALFYMEDDVLLRSLTDASITGRAEKEALRARIKELERRLTPEVVAPHERCQIVFWSNDDSYQCKLRAGHGAGGCQL